MLSLLDIASTYVGENASIFSVAVLNDLPRRVRENLLPYLCAYHLHEITENKKDWLQCNELWKKHVLRRWNRSNNVVNHIFNDTEQVPNYHQVYLSKHFLDLLNFCCLNVYTPDPHELLMCPLHKLQRWNMPHNTDPQSFHHLDQLIHYSSYAETLSVVGSQCSWICSNKKLLQNLLRVTKNINVHVITDLYYEGVRTLLWTLINHGNLMEATFSSFTSSLSRSYVLDLLQICAGIRVHKTVQKSDRLPTTSAATDAPSGLKRKRTSDERASMSKFKSVVKLDSDYDSPCAKKVCIRLDDPDNSPNQSVISIETSEEIPAICDVIDFTNVDSTPDRSSNNYVESDNTDEDDNDIIDDDGDDDGIIASSSKDKSNDIFGSHGNKLLQIPSVNIYSSKCVESTENDNNGIIDIDEETNLTKAQEKRPLVDLFDEAIQPVKENPSQSGIYDKKLRNNQRKYSATNLEVTASFPTIGSAEGIKGLKSFAMTCNQLGVNDELIKVLPEWSSLRKFALFYTDICCEDFTEILMEKVRTQQLSHLVLDDANFHISFFEKLLHNLQENYSDPTHKAPIELIDLQASTVFLEMESPVTYTGPQFGVVKLDLSMNTLAPSGLDGLLSLIQYDRALTHLKLNGCFLQEHQVVLLLQTLSERRQLEMLGLSGNRVTDTLVEVELLSFLQTVTSLKCLLLNYSRMRSQFVSSTEFVKAVKNHPNLQELSLKNNHLELGACKLLSGICCCEEKVRLQSLNIGYNWIKTSDLLECAGEIRCYQQSHMTQGRPILDYLSISGNRLQHWSQEQVRQAYRGLVRELEVDSIDYSNPHAEHLGQM